MGHAVDNTMQDILIRTKRMQGYAALWVPGTDHASIATEAKVVEAMRAEGPDQGNGGPRRLPGARLGLEDQSTATASSASSRSWAAAATGSVSASPWTRAALRLSRKSLSACTTRASSTAATAWSTGAPTAIPPFPTPRWSMRKRTAASGTCSTRSRRPARCWNWLLPVLRPCWAIPLLPSTAMTPAMLICTAAMSSCPC